MVGSLSSTPPVTPSTTAMPQVEETPLTSAGTAPSVSTADLPKEDEGGTTGSGGAATGGL